MKALLTILLALSTQAFAENLHHYSNRGVMIKPLEQVSAPLEYKEGDQTTFEGEICAISEGHFKNGKEQCSQINGNLEIKAFFPNPTVDVTHKLKITKKSQSHHYSFETSELKRGEGNALTIVVGPVKSQTYKLFEIKAKIDRRIDLIEKRILSYKLTQKHSYYLSFLLNLKQKLESVSEKINAIIENEPLAIAKFSRPLQVEADAPKALYYHSTFNGQRLVLEIPKGLPRIGEPLTINAKVLNQNLKDPSNKALTEKYKVRFLIDDNLIHESNHFSNAAGQTFAFSHSLSNHLENRSRQLNLELYAVKETEKGKTSKIDYKLEGKIDLTIPAPLSTIDKTPPVIDLAIQDNLHLNVSNILLSGSIFDNSDVSHAIFLNNQLVVENDSYLINYELPLSQGQNTIKIKAMDIWGNSSEITKTVIVDSSAPIIFNSQNFIKLTSQKLFQIQTQVFDQNEVTTRILHNGQEVLTTDSKSINYFLNLVEGTNSIKIESTDSFGNLAVPVEVSGIVLDTTPPTIAFTHTPSIPNPEQEITIDATASSDANGIKNFSILSSGIVLASSPSGILKFKIQESGDHQITVKAEDNVGNPSVLLKTIHINAPPIASLTATPSTGSAPLVVGLDASSSTDEGSLTYHFNFGDGSPVVVTSISKITHTYGPGIFTASVKVLDLQGLESISNVQINTSNEPLEGAPLISIITTDASKLLVNYLHGERIELDASHSTGGNGDITKYEWRKDNETLGYGDKVIIPSNTVGQFNITLIVSNSNNISSKKSFTLSVSPNVTPQISINQLESFVPSQVNITLTNSHEFIGIQKISWLNLRTGDKFITQSYSQLIEQVGLTTLNLSIEDNYGYIYTKEILLTLLNDGPFIEGPAEIDVILGDRKEISYKIYDDLDSTLEVKEVVPGVIINELGYLSIHVNEIPQGPNFITLIASNGIRVFEKQIKVNWLTPTTLATIPSGFYGKYVINAPDSILNKTEVMVTEEMTTSPMAITFLEVKSSKGTYLITRTQGGELKNPLQIITPDGVLGTHLSGNSKMFSILSYFRENFSNSLFNCLETVIFQEVPFNEDKSKLPIYTSYDSGGLKIIAKGTNFADSNLSKVQKDFLNKLVSSFVSIMGNQEVTIYIGDNEMLPPSYGGGVYRFDTRNILINVHKQLHQNFYSTPEEAVSLYSGILRHESRHIFQNSKFGCKAAAYDKETYDFFIESEAEHYMIVSSNDKEKEAFFKYDINYKDFRNDLYFNFPRKTIEGSIDRSLNSNVEGNPYIFSLMWDLIDPNDFYDWMKLEPAGLHLFSSNKTILKDYLSSKDYPFGEFLMDYENIAALPRKSNAPMASVVGRLLTNDQLFENTPKAIKKIDLIKLQPASADIRVITREFLVDNDMINADGFAFVQVIQDGLIGMHGRLQTSKGKKYFLEGDQRPDPDLSPPLKIYENECLQCELIFSNTSEREQNLEVLVYGATKIVSDPGNKLWPTNGGTITWDGTMYIKHYEPYYENTEETAIHSRVDPGNSLYVNHLAPVYIWDCENGGEEYCSYKIISSLSLTNNYLATLKPDTLGTCGFTGEGCYDISILPGNGLVFGQPSFRNFFKGLNINIFPAAYAHDYYYPMQGLHTPEEVLGVTIESKRQQKEPQ